MKAAPHGFGCKRFSRPAGLSVFFVMNLLQLIELPPEAAHTPLPDSVLNGLSVARREKAAGMKKPLSAWRIAAGCRAARSLLVQAGAPPGDSEFLSYDDKGKPLFDPPNGLHISFSHAGSFVVAVLSDRPCGVDIEKNRRIDPRVGRHIFSPSDMEGVLTGPEDEQTERFFKTWAIKESVSKWLGTGISAELRAFSIRWKSEDACEINADRYPQLFGMLPEAPGGFTLAAVTETMETLLPLEPLFLTDLNQFYQ